MTAQEMDLSHIMTSLLRGTRTILRTTAAIDVDAVEHFDGAAAALDLHDTTAVVGFGTPLGIRTAFCFAPSLLEALYGRITADIRVPLGEEDQYTRDAAAEVANMVQGLCSADFSMLPRALDLFPPTVVAGERRIDRPENAFFGTMRIRTSKGWLSIHLLRPEVLFDTRLRHVVH